MTMLLRFPTPQRSDEEQAAAWLARLSRGLHGDEPAQFSAWMRQSRRRRRLLHEMARMWDQMDVLGELAELFPLQESSASVRPWLVAGLATSFAAFAVVGVLLHRHRVVVLPPERSAVVTSTLPTAPAAATSAVYTASFATAIGQERVVELPDHSVIRLNTNTAISVLYTATNRRLLMSRGEANFEVAKDPSRVFTVRVAGYDFKAVGTAFDIRADAPGGLRLMVTEGRVRVHRAPAAAAVEGTPSDAGVTSFEDATDVEVAANKQVSIGRTAERIETLSPVQVSTATAWQRGVIAFDGVPLEQALSEMARYFTPRFVIADPQLAHLSVSGYFKVGDLDALTKALQRNFGIVVQQRDHEIVLTTTPRDN